MKKLTAIALETCGYDDYPVPNWIKGEKYGAIDKGNTLVMGSETGNFYFTGEAKKRLPEMFHFEQV